MENDGGKMWKMATVLGKMGTGKIVEKMVTVLFMIEPAFGYEGVNYP